MFLLETRFDKVDCEFLRIKLGFDFAFAVERAKPGGGGGLLLLWQSTITLDLLSFSSAHIDTRLRPIGGGPQIRFTGFYGHPITSRRGESWALLQQLASQFSMPWICIGDFNEMLTAAEKRGRLSRSESQMQKFRDTLGACELRDLGFRGSPYTWCNQRLGMARTFERLDRCVANVEWQQCYSRYEVSHIIPPVSDHLMLKLETVRIKTVRTYKG